MTESGFSNFLLGRLTAIEDRLRAELPPAAAAAPALVPVVRFDPTQPPADYRERSQWYSDHLAELAGPVKPPAAKPAPEPLPATLSKSSSRFQRDMIKYVAEVASGKIEVVD